MLTDEKKRLRAEFSAVRKTISPHQRMHLEELLERRLFALRELQDASLVLCYWSMKDEVGTHQIIQRLWKEGKKVALPRCTETLGLMEFYLVTDPSQLVSARFGLSEPDPQRCTLVEDYTNSFCVVPALACDSRGYRLGYGGGYYDRFLRQYSYPTAAIVFSHCFVSCLPAGLHDQRVDYVITEEATYAAVRQSYSS